MADKPVYTKLAYFQYYPADFEQGTATFTLTEVGAYQRLLNYQWTHGSVPGDIKALTQILRCTPATAKSVWKTISVKFQCGEDGQWRNARLSAVYAEALIAWQRQVDRGKASAAAREQRRLNGGSPPVEPADKPVVNQSESESESKEEEKSKEQTPPPPAAAPKRGGGLLVSPLQFAKLQEKFAHVGARLRVPHVLHDELRTKLGGEQPDVRLSAWYGELDAEIERTGEPIPDVFAWLRPKFVAFAEAAATDAVKQEFLRRVANRGQ